MFVYFGAPLFIRKLFTHPKKRLIQLLAIKLCKLCKKGIKLCIILFIDSNIGAVTI